MCMECLQRHGRRNAATAPADSGMYAPPVSASASHPLKVETAKPAEPSPKLLHRPKRRIKLPVGAVAVLIVLLGLAIAFVRLKLGR